jgi:hypothetical protein
MQLVPATRQFAPERCTSFSSADLIASLCRDKHVTELDVTALQSLWAADREARGSGRSIKLAGPVPAEILAAVNDAGFENFPIASALE